MQLCKLIKWIFFCCFVLLNACAPRFSHLVVAEPAMVQDCDYIDTVSDLSDPGKSLFPNKYGKYYDGERKVLERASDMGGTHIVWQYNYAIGSSASVYRCGK